ncbi:MAG: preprotein translocase subunit YajC [bacterium]
MHSQLVDLVATALPLAMAPSTGDAGGNSAFWANFATLPIIIGIFYFLMIRPQQQKAKEHQSMLDALKKGDEVLTAGGIYGKIHSVTDQVVTLEIAPNVRIRVARSRIEGKESKSEAKASE